ncbi:MAG: S1C family serine protease [Oscillospiraceae bacterium]|jgi:serine protease Do|nr:S1C family serine protease [Oscillospiraceae bacterium]
MNYNYGGGYTDGEPEYNSTSGIPPAPSGEPESAGGAPRAPEDGVRRPFSERTAAVPEGARPYVGGERVNAADAERAPFAGDESPAPPMDDRQPRNWSEADYRALPEREINAYTPGIPDPAQYSQHRRSAPADGRENSKARGRRGGFGRFLRAACLVVVCAAAGAAGAYGVVEYRYNGQEDGASATTVVLGNPPSQSAPPSIEGGTQALTSPAGAMSPNAIYEAARKQVVSVTAEASANAQGSFWGAATSSSGSGFIISNDGYILTNYHVIEAALSPGYTLKVYMEDGSFYEAQIIGSEKDNDVAVLKIDASGLNAVTTGDSDAARVGESIYAVGDPLGHLEYTMTDGIISALDRVVTVDSQTSISMFQISAAVNSGNSGGPVYNSNGEVIGIVSAKYMDFGIEGLGFAIPINDAVHIAEQLIATGYVTDKAYLGVSVRTVSASTAEYYNMAEGAYVSTVEQGSCSEAAGVKIGDIITKLGDFTVTSSDTLKLAKQKYRPGDTVDIVVYRAGETLTLRITLDRTPSADGSESGTVPTPAPRSPE